MTADVDAEVLAGGRQRGRGGSKDLGAPLRCQCQACAEVKTDGEIDVVAGHEAAPVGEEEKQRNSLR